MIVPTKRETVQSSETRMTLFTRRGHHRGRVRDHRRRGRGAGTEWFDGLSHVAEWVEPELLAEIEYRAKSAEGKVRHPFFKGLREDI